MVLAARRPALTSHTDGTATSSNIDVPRNPILHDYLVIKALGYKDAACGQYFLFLCIGQKPQVPIQPIVLHALLVELCSRQGIKAYDMLWQLMRRSSRHMASAEPAGVISPIIRIPAAIMHVSGEFYPMGSVHICILGFIVQEEL